METSVVTEPRPVLGVVEKLLPMVLAAGAVVVAVTQWDAVPPLVRFLFIVCIAAFVGQTVHGFSSVEVATDELTLHYPLVSFSYAPDRIISIERPAVPPAIRIRPKGRRLLAYVLYRRSVRNIEAVDEALRVFAARHSIPATPS